MFYARGKAWNSETRKWDKPVRVEFSDYMSAIRWCNMNREWMVDLYVDGSE